MTYNIRHGLGNDVNDPKAFGELDLERVAEVIRQAGPDIVALQEVDRFNPRSLSVDQPAALGEMLGMKSCYGVNVIYEAGEYGVAILSRFPIVSFTNTPLPTTRGWEVRGLLEATVHVPDIGDVTIFNTHLQVGHEETETEAARERGEQAAVVADRVRVVNTPVVLMGDFNAQPGDPELQPFEFLADAWSMAGDGGPGFTIPSHPAAGPSVRIDVIYVGARFQVRSACVFSDPPAGFASDHLPVVADLEV
jgi:endonuclease/exonuclease/phosphatase family metal-dependent hydrolase